MRVYKCDRCKAIYTQNKPAFVICDVSCAREDSSRLPEKLVPENCDDLCPDCQEELTIWKGEK